MDMLTEVAVQRIFYLFKAVVPLIAAGIIGANILVEFGLTDKLAFLSSPLIRGGNLPEEAGATITTLLLSGTASYSMLANYHEQGVLNEKETIITTFSNTFFGYLNHLPNFYLPLVLPLLGLSTGLLYIGVRLTIALMITLVGVFIGHLYLDPPDKPHNPVDVEERDGRTNKEKIRGGIENSLPVLKKIVPRIILIYILVNIAFSAGFFQPIARFAEPATRIVGLPGEASAIVAARFFDVTSSVTIAGELLANNNAITPTQTIGALLLGSIFSTSVFFVKHSLPNQVAYFGPKLGTKIALYNLSLNLCMTSMAVALLFFIG